MWDKLTFKQWGLTIKFWLVFLVMITLPTVVFGTFIYIDINESFKNQATESTEAILDKIEMSLTSVIEDVESITAYAIYNEDFRTYMTTAEDNFNEPFYTAAIENIKGYLTFQLLSADYINSLSIVGKNGNRMDFGEPVSGDEEKWHNLAIKQEGSSVWSNAYELSSGWHGKKRNLQIVSLSRVINDYNNIKKSIGFIQIRLDLEQLNKIIELSNLENEGTVYLHNADKNILLVSNANSETDWEKDFIHQQDNHALTTTQFHEGKEYLFVRRNVKDVDWDLIAVVNQDKVAAKLVGTKQLVRYMLIILPLLGLITFIGYYFTHIRRIISLTKVTEKIGNKDFDVQVEVTSLDEIGQLASHFNNMIDTIRNLIDKEYKLKIKQKETELKALQNQIDPHFLYNTLDMIRWKARIEQAPETSHLIEMLSKIFRNTLKDDQLFILLKDELEFIHSYLEFQSRRMNGKLKYVVHNEIDTKKFYIIKQTIQPLIENSIKHGFFQWQDDMFIEIHCYVSDKSLFIEVLDNGEGMTEERFIEVLESHENHGLKNIEERIQLAFGSSYGLTFVNQKQQGTLISIEIPILDVNIKRKTSNLGDE